MIVPGKRLQDYQSSWKEKATVAKTDLKKVKSESHPSSGMQIATPVSVMHCEKHLSEVVFTFLD